MKRINGQRVKKIPHNHEAITHAEFVQWILAEEKSEKRIVRVFLRSKARKVNMQKIDLFVKCDNNNEYVELEGECFEMVGHLHGVEIWGIIEAINILC